MTPIPYRPVVVVLYNVFAKKGERKKGGEKGGKKPLFL